MCIQRCYKARRLASNALADSRLVYTASPPVLPAASELLSGTWDFKWFPGSVIRVAFQQLPADAPEGLDFETTKSRVVEKLELWFGKGSSIASPNLDFVVVADLPPPPTAPAAGPRSAKSRTSNSMKFIEYDVLISILPLPLLLPETEQHPESIVGTSTSELGRYALRSEYGVPTTYLGPQPGRDIHKWFGSVEGEFTVAHELGHVLGLPHEQQNPLLDHAALRWKRMDQMVKIVNQKGGLAPTIDVRDFIETEVKGPWPGGKRFSDWRKPASIPSDLATLDFASVMAKPSVHCLLEGGHRDNFDCSALASCPFEHTLLERLTQPTSGDLQHLLKMYGPRIESSTATSADSREAAQ